MQRLSLAPRERPEVAPQRRHQRHPAGQGPGTVPLTAAFKRRAGQGTYARTAPQRPKSTQRLLCGHAPVAPGAGVAQVGHVAPRLRLSGCNKDTRTRTRTHTLCREWRRTPPGRRHEPPNTSCSPLACAGAGRHREDAERCRAARLHQRCTQRVHSRDTSRGATLLACATHIAATSTQAWGLLAPSPALPRHR